MLPIMRFAESVYCQVGSEKFAYCQTRNDPCQRLVNCSPRGAVITSTMPSPHRLCVSFGEMTTPAPSTLAPRTISDLIRGQRSSD